jgi:probable F420-dependent oxidoreductase
MHIGIAVAVTDHSVHPGTLARLAEERGLESLFVTEHTHIPSSRATPYPGGEMPEAYMRTLDPLIALTAAAAQTTTLRLGTAVFLAAQHESLATAKAVASLDLLSGGRVELGVGAGWLVEELANHGVGFDTRFGQMREHVEAMRALWSEEIASYSGRHVSFDRVWSWPKPVQRPGPPVLVAGDGATVLDRVLAYGDGWLPRSPGSPAALAARIAVLHARCGDAGRAALPVTLYGAPANASTLDQYALAGVHRALLRVRETAPGEIERELDAIAQLAAAVPG